MFISEKYFNMLY